MKNSAIFWIAGSAAAFWLATKLVPGLTGRAAGTLTNVVLEAAAGVGGEISAFVDEIAGTGALRVSAERVAQQQELAAEMFGEPVTPEQMASVNRILRGVAVPGDYSIATNRMASRLAWKYNYDLLPASPYFNAPNPWPAGSPWH